MKNKTEMFEITITDYIYYKSKCVNNHEIELKLH